MSLDVAEKAALFCETNDVRFAAIMGGEFFLHPQWEQVLETISRSLLLCRLVTNGDWAGKKALSKRVIAFLKAHDNFYVSISKDRWHTNQHVEVAAKLLDKANITYRMPKPEQVTSDTIVPAGRGDGYGPYNMLMCYCHNPEHQYSFLVDETGQIYKCGFGAWVYDNIEHFTQGGFAERFRQFNRAFYRQFIPNCRRCLDESSIAGCRLIPDRLART
jgi:hypothetical protein